MQYIIKYLTEGCVGPGGIGSQATIDDHAGRCRHLRQIDFSGFINWGGRGSTSPPADVTVSTFVQRSQRHPPLKDRDQLAPDRPILQYAPVGPNLQQDTESEVRALNDAVSVIFSLPLGPTDRRVVVPLLTPVIPTGCVVIVHSASAPLFTGRMRPHAHSAGTMTAAIKPIDPAANSQIAFHAQA